MNTVLTGRAVEMMEAYPLSSRGDVAAALAKYERASRKASHYREWLEKSERDAALLKTETQRTAHARIAEGSRERIQRAEARRLEVLGELDDIVSAAVAGKVFESLRELGLTDRASAMRAVESIFRGGPSARLVLGIGDTTN